MEDKTIKGLQELNERIDGSNFRILIVHTRWNATVVDPLVKGARETLLNKYCVKEENICVYGVPGSYELPYTAKHLINAAKLKGNPFDAVICIGVLIKGSTSHYEYICEAVSQGIMRVNLDTDTPVIFGVLTCLDEKQAFLRAGIGANSHNHAIDWAGTAIEMARVRSHKIF
ncbi:6,7-dimethyl-8-ribityllumazine synthase [Neocallimastix sp. 'constans']|jgi:6,7-dimethyl-8-ribityllumazine synthase